MESTMTAHEEILHVLQLRLPEDRFEELQNPADSNGRLHSESHQLIGLSVWITLREDHSGNPRISASLRERYRAITATGKIHRRWRSAMTHQVMRTSKDLVLHRTFSTKNAASSEHLSRDAECVSSDMHPQSNNPRERLHLSQVREEASRSLISMLKTWHIDTYNENFEVLLQDEKGTHSITLKTADQMIKDVFTATAAAIDDRIGPLPLRQKRYPLLRPNYGDTGLQREQFFLDASDYRQVTINVFSAKHTTRPLVREVTALFRNQSFINAVEILSWLKEFRGLVPTEAIVAALHEVNDSELPPVARISPSQAVVLRKILKATPAPVLRRILAEPFMQWTRVFNDVLRGALSAKFLKLDLEQLGQVLAGTRQKDLRTSRDLEQLIQRLPEQRLYRNPRTAASQRSAEANQAAAAKVRDWRQYCQLSENPIELQQWMADADLRAQAAELLAQARRERMAAAERERAERAEAQRRERLEAEAERAEWAKATTKALEALDLDDYRIIVASSWDTLQAWSQQLRNCIHLYSDHIGLDVLAAVVRCDDPDVPILNLEITQASGLLQFLGHSNKDAHLVMPIEDAQRIFDAVVFEARIPMNPHALGVDHLNRPQAAKLASA